MDTLITSLHGIFNNTLPLDTISTWFCGYYFTNTSYFLLTRAVPDASPPPEQVTRIASSCTWSCSRTCSCISQAMDACPARTR